MLYEIHKKRTIFYRQYRKAKKKNMHNWKELYERFIKVQRNYVTKTSRQNRRDNLITDFKKLSASNDLTSIWKTIKHATYTECKFSSGSKSLTADID